MVEIILDNIETASPYIVCMVIGFALGAGFILYKDREYKKHLRCAGCQKKMFSVHQDDKTSDNFTENERQNLAFMRHLVLTGRVTDHL